MSLLSQPPPDVPAPPPGEAAIRSRNKWLWMLFVGFCSMVFGVVWLFQPVVIRSPKKSDKTEAVNNARQIGLALFEFETEYGQFPGPNTIAEVKRNTGSKLPLGTTTSNDYLRQLLAAGIASTETMFYAKRAGSPKGAKRKEVKEVLGKGECGFVYLGAGRSAMGNPARILLVGPVIPGTDRFDPTVFDGKAVVLKMDNSVATMPIGADGKVMQHGMNVFDPAHPLWEGKPLIVAWPE